MIERKQYRNSGGRCQIKICQGGEETNGLALKENGLLDSVPGREQRFMLCLKVKEHTRDKGSIRKAQVKGRGPWRPGGGLIQIEAQYVQVAPAPRHAPRVDGVDSP